MPFFRYLPSWAVELITPATVLQGTDPWVTSNQGPSNPTIANTSLPLAGTEYALALPAGTRRFLIRARGSSKLQVSFISGQTGVEYVTVSTGSVYSENDVYLPAGLTLYAQASQADEIVEGIYWT